MVSAPILHLLEHQRNRPLSIAVAIGVLFLPMSLIIFIARPALFHQLSVSLLLVLAASASLPIVMLCYGIWHSLLHAAFRADRIRRQIPGPSDLTLILAEDEHLEWPCLLAGSWTAAIVLFLIACIAYLRPIRIGMTLIVTGGILFALMVVLSGYANWLVTEVKNQVASDPQT